MTDSASRVAAPAIPAAGAWLPRAAAVRVFACFAAAYFLSYALRAINAVIAPSLVAEFSLTSTELGALTSAYLVAFAAMQLPLGWCLDRFGPRRTESALLLVAAAGSLVYATADSVIALWIGRAMIGLGVSACLMGAFKAYRLWYPPQRQGQLGAWMLVAGTSGVLLTTVPVQWALPWLGWRGLFWLIAALLAAAAAALLAGVPRQDRPAPEAAAPGSAGPRIAPAAAPDGYRAVVADPFFWRMALTGVFFQGGFIALQTLWAGPWFTTVLAATPEQASWWLMGFNVALMGAYIALGWLAPVFHRLGWTPPAVALVANGLHLLVLGAVVLAGMSGAWWWWVGIAALTTTNLLLQTHVNMHFPASIAGRASTAFNFLIFVGAFALQAGLGMAIDAFRQGGDAPAEAFRHALGLLWGLQAAAWAAFLAWRLPAADAGVKVAAGASR